MKTKHTLIPTLAASALCISIAQAQFAIYEGFDTPGYYADGTEITSQTPSGGSGDWTGNWAAGTTPGNGDFDTVSGSLTYTDGNGNILDTTSGSLIRNGGSNTIISRALDQTAFSNAVPEDGGVAWFSMLVDVNANTRINLYVGDGGNRGTGINIGDTGSNSTLEARTNNAKSSGQVLADGTYFLLGRATYSTTNPTQLDLWVDPILNEALLGAPTLSVSNAAWTAAQTDQIYIQSKNNGNQVLDEIRVSDAFADVAPIFVPEPSHLVSAFGMLTLLALMTTSRKRLNKAE